MKNIFKITMIMLALISWSNSGFSQEVVIEDFENYTVGSNFDGSGDWYNTVSCHSIITDEGGLLGKTAKSSSCASGNSAWLDYSFPFTTTSLSTIKFQGRITSGSGNNCAAKIGIMNDTENFRFGLSTSTSDAVYNQTAFYTLEDGWVYGTTLTLDTWYDFKLEIDWSYTDANGKYGIATMFYKETTSNIWIVETVAENKELHVTDPTSFNKILARLDGLGDRLGQIDNIVYSNQSIYSISTDATYGQVGNPVEIPVTATSELTTDDGIYSYQFVYNFDDTRLQYVDYDLTGTIAEGGTVNVNTSVAGQLTVSCMRATPIAGQGDLIYFNFNAIAEGTSPLTVSNFKYNETDVTDITNGDITIVPVTVADVTYSTDVILPGTELEITVDFNNAITGTPQFDLSGANTLSATDLVNVSGTTFTYTFTVEAGEGIVNLGVLGTDEYGFPVTYTPTTGATFEILSLTYGDVTDNGEITAYDAALTLMYSVGVDPMPSITPLPWDLWRILTADVDGSNDITATDAGLILQYSVGLINIFPVEDPAKSGNDKSGDISVEIIDDEFVFTTQDELVGFNLFVTNNSNIILGEPQILDETMLSATQIENEIYNVGMCIAISPANGTQIMKIPFTGELTGQLTFDMKVNNSDKSVTFGTTGINEVADNGISIYPNPAKEMIQISTDYKLDKSTVQIYSITGSLVDTKSLNSQNEINISTLSSGTYLIKINIDNKTLTEKFIKE